MLCASTRLGQREHRDGVGSSARGRLGCMPRRCGGCAPGTDRGRLRRRHRHPERSLPFAAPLATRSPVVVLVHPRASRAVADRLRSVTAKVGWTIESRVSPLLSRPPVRRRLAGDPVQRLAELGVDPADVAIIHNGTDIAPASVDPSLVGAPVEGRARPAGAPKAGRACHHGPGQAAATSPRSPLAHRRGRVNGKTKSARPQSSRCHGQVDLLRRRLG